MVAAEQTQAMSNPYLEVVNTLGHTVSLDREQAFLLFTAFMGDLEKTAQALGIAPVALLRVVDDEGWLRTLEPILKLRKSDTPLDFERGLNRALNFVQAHRLRLFLERALRVFSGWSEAELLANINTVKTTPGGITTTALNVRALTDFAAALEKAHAMTYAALSDTASDRSARKGEQAQSSVGEMHLKLADAMAKVGSSKSPRSVLLGAQLAEAQDVAIKRAIAAAVPSPTAAPVILDNPLDCDDH
jgi:hypothetical protein